jgi:hypothetical protein
VGAVNLDDRALQVAWASRTHACPAAEGCPGADRIWGALTGESAAAECRAVIEHVAVCPACAESWRLGLHLSEQRPREARREVSRALSWLRPMSVAAGLVLMVVGWWAVRQTSDPVVRTVGDVEIRSVFEDRQALPRSDFVLRWTPGPDGTVYDIEVGTSDLRSLARAYALTEARYRVPDSALAGLPAGTEIAWRVQATLPDGRTVASLTHLNVVE